MPLAYDPISNELKPNYTEEKRGDKNSQVNSQGL